jgi:hypothetical protein
MTTPTTGRKGATTRKDASKHAPKEAGPAQRRPAVAPQKAKAARKAGLAPKAADKRKLGSGAARQGTKTEKILELLKRPGGATLKEIMKATSWQPHSVRGFLAGTLRKTLGIGVESFKSDANERSYRVPSK